MKFTLALVLVTACISNALLVAATPVPAPCPGSGDRCLTPAALGNLDDTGRLKKPGLMGKIKGFRNSIDDKCTGQLDGSLFFVKNFCGRYRRQRGFKPVDTPPTSAAASDSSLAASDQDLKLERL